MSDVQKPKPANTQMNPDNTGAIVELDANALRNLAGLLDVLVQMDLAQEKNEENKEEYATTDRQGV